MELCGKEIRFRGRLIRTAFLDGEGYQFLAEPATVLKVLRECGARIDLFTFIQRVSERAPKYEYPMEWDNIAVLPISSFENWLTHQIGFKVRNKIHKAQRSGVVVREVS